MVDLENLLLEAAGRTGSGGKSRHSTPSSRTRRENLYSDNDDSDHDCGYTIKKTYASQVPLKKRPKESQDDEDERSGHEGVSGDVFDVGSGLYNMINNMGAEADDDKIELLLSQVKGKDITKLIACGREK